MKKINLKWSVRPKLFWSSIIIFLLIVSSIFYMFKERTLRISTQEQLEQTIVEKNEVVDKLLVTIKSKNIVEKELAAERERSFILEKKVEQKERQIKLTLDRLDKEITARCEAETQLVITTKEKEILEEKIRKSTRVPKAIELEKIVVKPASGLAGKVLAANKEYGFIVVNLGKANNLKLGDLLSVYRNDVFIGKVEIEKLYEKRSAAAILSEWRDAEFKENDEVRKL